MIPETRSEIFLATIAGEEHELPAPQSRIEHYLNAIAQAGDIHGGSAGAVIYDKDASYPDGSVGAAMQEMDGEISENTSDISQLKSQIAELHTLVPITLAANGWTGGLQTVTVAGVLADETEQMITIVPASASRVEFERSMVEAVGQDYNTVTFSFLTVPKSDLSVYVIINNVGVAS
jgi:hypothetical protein